MISGKNSLRGHNVNVKSIRVGDVFMRVMGNRWTITEIWCAFDEDAGRWETMIKYEAFDGDTGISQVIEKARIVLQSLKADIFYSQEHVSGEVTQLDTFKSTCHSVFQNDFIANADRYGLAQSDLGRTILVNEKKYQVVGAKPQDNTHPIVVESESGKLYRFSSNVVKRGLDLFNNHMVLVK